MKYWLLFFALTFNSCLYASEAALNQILVRVINQINAIMPLLDEAEKEVDPTNRLQFHIDSFKSADGNFHPGLRQDLLEIRNTLIDYINKPAIEPKTVKPLALDFIGR
ncbi:RAQPRD family integrative conjugative element protein [Legionella sp. D16C41]|uniref:RAQPRD family integrative conjugative element protein n=1 Tax=Legionella TaxID=445 RepID=UPI00104177B7|nr:RAQPRD family integrative conjugative element protein [Legionella gresilensis]